MKPLLSILLSLALSSSYASDLVINELMASNAGMVMSPATNFDSWIELYNPNSTAVNLAGLYLSNNENNLTFWKMPNDIGSVPAKGYLVVWLGSNEIKSNQAPFKLDCDGGTIYLSDKSGQLITSEVYPEAMSRTAYARKGDGVNDWGWTATPTPGATNKTAVFASERLDAPVVSTGSQLLNGPLSFHVDIPEGATLMYSTDGTMPTAINDGCKESKNGQFTVSGTTSYVFRLFKDGFLPSVPVTRSFIKTDNKYTIPVISIVGDERYFTDSMWGIDVKGQNGITGNGSDDPVNWNQPWDRPVNFSYISPTEGMLFNQDVNISVSGGWTRRIDPRSMKLKSNKVFDGQNRFDYVFFPQKPFIRSKALVVRNGGNDVYSGSRFMDPALATIIQRSGIDLDVQSFLQVAEYINGRFKGVLNLREPNNDKFVYANFGYDDEEIDMFENDEFVNGTDEAYLRLVKLSEHINDAGVYDQVKALLDIDEFTNYMATELYIGNDDWPENNVKAYRSQMDGRFRFVCFDLDYAFNAWDRRLSSLDDYNYVKMVRLFKNLLKHDAYRKKFIDTFCIMAGSVFEKTRATAIVNELADAMRPMSQYDGVLPDNSANKMKEKLVTRLDDMTSQLQKYEPMQLSDVKKQSVTFSADVAGASISLNGIEVPYASFNGKLFSPVQIQAKAPAGYTFAGWRKSSNAFVQVFPMNATWKYYDGGQAPANWQSDAFNDTSWKSGAAPLGYKMNGVKTTVSYGSDSQQKNPTTYFRKTFTLNAAPNNNDSFQLSYQLDDGCVVWVNGQEAGRVNMRQGTVSYETFSSTYAADDPFTGTMDLNPLLFKKGSNVIAVEVHNISYTSGDLLWAGELQTTVGANSNDEILQDAVINVTDDAVRLTAMFTPLSADERTAKGLHPVCVNEVSADNGIYVDEHFKRNDWVELYNTTNQPIDVEGMYLSDNAQKPKKYQITKGGSQASTIIPAHGYLIIWCDKLDPLSQLHASFKLDADGGDVLLTAADESWTDQLTYTAHHSDQTVGRYPDGYPQVFVMNVPTIAKTNITSSYVSDITNEQTTGIVNVTTSTRRESQQIYNLNGQMVKGALAPGIYIINGRKVVIKRK